ncbi:hypothetical protein Bbelb_061650 [Branchiostoma belcheri]|nr:hypothetical protein Bbelb_061650 [Branchiostoma belcheri]
MATLTESWTDAMVWGLFKMWIRRLDCSRRKNQTFIGRAVCKKMGRCKVTGSIWRSVKVGRKSGEGGHKFKVNWLSVPSLRQVWTEVAHPRFLPLRKKEIVNLKELSHLYELFTCLQVNWFGQKSPVIPGFFQSVALTRGRSARHTPRVSSHCRRGETPCPPAENSAKSRSSFNLSYWSFTANHNLAVQPNRRHSKR